VRAAKREAQERDFAKYMQSQPAPVAQVEAPEVVQAPAQDVNVTQQPAETQVVEPEAPTVNVAQPEQTAPTVNVNAPQEQARPQEKAATPPAPHIEQVAPLNMPPISITLNFYGDDNKPSDLIIDIVIDEEEETPINPGNELIVSLPNSKPDSNRIDDDLELKTVDIVAMSDDSQLTKVDLKDDKVNDNANEPSFVEKVIKAVVVTVSAAGTTGGIFFLIIWFRRRKVRGKLISKDGINYSNCVVTLEGKDKLLTRTNINGEFIFRNLKKDTYILTVFNESDEILFSCELLTSSKNMKDENVTVLENNVLAYQYGVAGQTYILDILA
jgi:hypothetical protein